MTFNALSGTIKLADLLDVLPSAQQELDLWKKKELDWKNPTGKYCSNTSPTV